METSGTVVITLEGLESLIGLLKRRGYRVIGPTVRDQAIIYDEIAALAELPRGWTDEQQSGHYRLVPRDDDAVFGYAVGPHSWKKFLHPPTELLWTAERTEKGLRVTAAPLPDERFAFIGVRGCDLHAIAIQDRVLRHGAKPFSSSPSIVRLPVPPAFASPCRRDQRRRGPMILL